MSSTGAKFILGLGFLILCSLGATGGLIFLFHSAIGFSLAAIVAFIALPVLSAMHAKACKREAVVVAVIALGLGMIIYMSVVVASLVYFNSLA